MAKIKEGYKAILLPLPLELWAEVKKRAMAEDRPVAYWIRRALTSAVMDVNPYGNVPRGTEPEPDGKVFVRDKFTEIS
jgi:hypothetical protein